VDKKLRQFIINTLRRASFRWKPRGEAKKRYKVKIGEYSTGRAKYGYTCADCKEVFKSKDVKVDHIEPVVNPLTGFTNFDDYVMRMFCEEHLMQVLCDSCHKKKSFCESQFRKRIREVEIGSSEYQEIEKEYLLFLEKFNEKG